MSIAVAISAVAIPASPRPHRGISVNEYSVKAYYLPRYSPSSPSSNAPSQLIDAAVRLKPSDWSIDLHRAFPNGACTDSYFIGGPPQDWPTPPCFCGKMLKSSDDGEREEENGGWDQYWDCTAVCKLRRRYQMYMQDQGKQYGDELGGNIVEYILFVEGGDESDQGDVPLLDREPGFEPDVPMPERAMVMVRVEGWVPVDVKPAIVDDQFVQGVGEDEMIYLKKFLKGLCSNEAAWKGRFDQNEAAACAT